MSISPVAPERRRVRHQAGEAVAVMMFSAGLSVAVALALLLVTSLGSRG